MRVLVQSDNRRYIGKNSAEQSKGELLPNVMLGDRMHDVVALDNGDFILSEDCGWKGIDRDLEHRAEAIHEPESIASLALDGRHLDGKSEIGHIESLFGVPLLQPFPYVFRAWQRGVALTNPRIPGCMEVEGCAENMREAYALFVEHLRDTVSWAAHTESFYARQMREAFRPFMILSDVPAPTSHEVYEVCPVQCRIPAKIMHDAPVLYNEDLKIYMSGDSISHALDNFADFSFFQLAYLQKHASTRCQREKLEKLSGYF
ncbi:hypothetical protein H6504_01020 [Candidatus Woesearchaeota archaeon]|nr:hypothetical protein [Candidatus Woesearchaeota archaeon]